MSQKPNLDQLKPFQPLISPNAVEYFENILTSDSVVFESGSGTSTLWLAKRVSKVLTTEDKPDWAEAVESALAQDSLSNVELSLISHEEHGNDYYDIYADHILQFPNESFDIVFVDGADRARVPVMTYAKKKIKPGGWLIVDDSNWDSLALGLRRLDSWPRATFCGWKEGAIDGQARYGCTTFFQKPTRSRTRVGIVSDWAIPEQVNITLQAYDKFKGSFDPFFLLLRGNPLDVSLINHCTMPQVTWTDFKKGFKLLYSPVSWARELELDLVLYTGPREEPWLEDLRRARFQASLLVDFERV